MVVTYVDLEIKNKVGQEIEKARFPNGGYKMNTPPGYP